MDNINSISNSLLNAMNIQDMRVKVASTNIASLNLVDQKG